MGVGQFLKILPRILKSVRVSKIRNYSLAQVTNVYTFFPLPKSRS